MTNRAAKQALRQIQRKQKGVWHRIQIAPPTNVVNPPKQPQPIPGTPQQESKPHVESASTQISRDVNNYHYDFEKVNRMTPIEMQYYLGIIYPDGYAVCEIPENCIQGLVVPQ